MVWNWLGRHMRQPGWLTSATPQRTTPRRRRRLLNLEQLEDRITPSTFTVTDLLDSPTDTGSLRYAVAQVNADDSSDLDTIAFASGLKGAIALSNGPLELSRTTGPIAITGPGADSLTIS